MIKSPPSIELNLRLKLSDPAYRQSFFLAETSAHIAKQLIELRKRRGFNQTQVAKLLKTGQPAISRVERADYRNWSFNTLRKLAEVLDARLRVLIEPSEDVISEYEPQVEDIVVRQYQPRPVNFSSTANLYVENEDERRIDQVRNSEIQSLVKHGSLGLGIDILKNGMNPNSEFGPKNLKPLYNRDQPKVVGIRTRANGV